MAMIVTWTRVSDVCSLLLQGRSPDQNRGNGSPAPSGNGGNGGGRRDANGSPDPSDNGNGGGGIGSSGGGIGGGGGGGGGGVLLSQISGVFDGSYRNPGRHHTYTQTSQCTAVADSASCGSRYHKQAIR